MTAVERVYSEGRSTAETLLVTSVKTNIGHTEACAGLAGLIKVFLCFKHKAVPPHLHFQKLNPKINLHKIPAIIPVETTEWKNETRIAAVSSYGMSGTNVHISLQEPPSNENIMEIAPNKTQMIGFSAKSNEALESVCHKYISHFEQNKELALSDIAFTLNTGRANFPYRIALVAKNMEQLITKLKQKNYVTGKTSVQKEKVIFLFTGQGSQYFGMAKNLYEGNIIFRRALLRCETLFQKFLTCSLKEVLWGNAALLDKTIYCQPAIFAVQFALVQLWHSFGIYPDAVLGHSVGEFCAAVCAGVLTLEEGMSLVAGRSKLVDSLERGKMLVVRTSPENVRSLIEEFGQTNSNFWLDIAAENSDEEVVVSGTVANIREFTNFCDLRGYKAQLVASSHAFHSRLTEPVLAEYGQLVANVKPKKLKYAYISGTFARELKQNDFTVSYWSRHFRDTVKFRDAIRVVTNRFADSTRVFIEIGTRATLLGLTAANQPNSINDDVLCPSLRRKEDDLSCILNSLSKMYVAGVKISWKNWFCQTRKVNLPTYPFERQKFWFQRENYDIELEHSFSLHPTLGHRLATAGVESIFNQTLSTKTITYITDHRVAERIIMPAAAYLETVMAAGCHVTQEGNTQVQFFVENFTVEAPMELNKSCRIQTIVRPMEENHSRFQVAIHKQSREEPQNWKLHANAIFVPNGVTSCVTGVDINMIQQELELVDSISNIYSELAKVGYQFGPTFRSISQAWIGKDRVLAEIEIPENSDRYICHPIVIDAMIQTLIVKAVATCQEKVVLKLQLPIGIKKFTWYSKTLSPKVFSYLTTSQGSTTVTLVNNTGQTMAAMEGIEFIETSVSRFLQTLSPQADSLPTFLEEVWRARNGITRDRINSQIFQINSSHFVKATLSSFAEMEDTSASRFEIIDKVFVWSLLKGILECAWPWPTVGENFVVNDWGKLAPELEIVKSGKLMEILTQFSYLKKIGDGNYQVLQALPTSEEIEKQILIEIEQHEKFSNKRESINLEFAKRCGLHLPSLLQRKMTPVSYMFPEDPAEVGALKLYSEGVGMKETGLLVTSLLLDCTCSSTDRNGVLRILEVGAGSGVTCALILETLDKMKVPCKYTFTDISPHFLNEAKTKFKECVTFALFDIEHDPLSQGFAPEEFDVIIGINVVHATADIAQALENLNLVLREGGILILGEMFVDRIWINLSFGFLDGWWRATDGRVGSPLLTETQWKRAFEQSGLIQTKAFSHLNGHLGAVAGQKRYQSCQTKYVQTLPDTSAKSWLFATDGTALVSKLSKILGRVGRSVIQFESSQSVPTGLEGVVFFWTNSLNQEENQERCKLLLNLVQKLDAAYQTSMVKPKLIVVTRGVYYLFDAGPGNPNAATVTSLIRTFANEHRDFKITAIDLDQDEINFGREAEETFAMLWSNDTEMFKTIREDQVFLQRLVFSDKAKQTRSFPNSCRFHVLKPVTKNLSDLEISIAPKVAPVEDEVEVTVRAVGLNFRDVFLALQPEGFVDPSFYIQQPGLEVAGIVSAIGPTCTKLKVGDAVFGALTGNGLASHVTVSSQYFIRKPENMSFTSAATIPVAFLTSLRGLQQLANLRAGERVLIHVATGGVGLAAIQIAKHFGAEIFATAGSKRKRAYLTSIGIQHVYHSRTTDFGDQILRDTNGGGINVVLNSLTGPGFKEASLKTCAPNARFIEIGKVNTWSKEEVHALRSDVKYFIFMLGLGLKEEQVGISELIATIETELKSGTYTTLPYQTFSLDRVCEAFSFFQGAKHIGKIVITIPEAKVSPDRQIIFEKRLFYPQSTYIITGGLGGIGLEVAKWMNKLGATNLVLVGRSKPSEHAAKVLDMLNTEGCRTMALQANVGIYKEAESLLNSIKHLNFPPVRGIMHAAGVLSDGTVVNQCWESFEKVFQPKVNGTWNLHNLTLGYDMEFFIMFSSVASNFGTPAQSTHSAANRFLDSFAQYRHSLCLPASSINFGAWAEVGVAAETGFFLQEHFGILTFSPEQGLAALQEVMEGHILQRSVLNVSDWATLKNSLNVGHYMDEIHSDNPVSKNITTGKTLILKEIEEATDTAERRKKIEEFVHTVLKETIRVDVDEELDPDKHFSEFGVDSLMTIELRNRLQTILRKNQLLVSAIQENRTIRKLVTHLETLLNSEFFASPIADLVKLDSVLPQEIQPIVVPPTKPSEFKEILLTGGTGHLGVNFIPALQKENPNLIIHCIVRGKNLAEATQRLNETLRLYSLLPEINFDKIRILVGDLSRKIFGLPQNVYDALALCVDAVVHCAAKANHVEGYDALGDDSIRMTNVVGTVNVLRFATTGKTKAILHASSMIAVTTANAEGICTEDFPSENDNGLSFKNGYVLSKYVCEKLMSQALARGIPVTVIRYVSIFGDSKTGYMRNNNDHALAILASCIRVRMFPPLWNDGYPIMPVDAAAKISAKIFLRDSSELGVYNLTSSSTISKEEVKEAFGKFGIHGEFVPFSDWTEVVFAETDFRKNDLSPFVELSDGGPKSSLVSGHPLRTQLATLQLNRLSDKVFQNYPEAASEIIATKEFLELILHSYFNNMKDRA